MKVCCSNGSSCPSRIWYHSVSRKNYYWFTSWQPIVEYLIRVVKFLKMVRRWRWNHKENDDRRSIGTSYFSSCYSTRWNLYSKIKIYLSFRFRIEVILTYPSFMLLLRSTKFFCYNYRSFNYWSIFRRRWHHRNQRLLCKITGIP